MNLYVSNLSYHTGEDELKDLFSQFGDVTSVRVVKDTNASKPRRFAFVEMPKGDDGHAAINKLNGKEIEGRPLSVSVARRR